MELDDLKVTWAAHGAMLERSVAINEHLLRETMLGKVRSRLVPFLAWRVLEVALGIVMMVLTGSLVAAHASEPRYLVAGGAVLAFSIAITALCAMLLALGARLEYDQPVTVIQRAVERLKRAEFRATKWAVLGGVLVWLPVLLLLFEAATDIPALARVDLAWLVSNLVFGVIVLVLGHVLAKRHVDRPDLGPRARALVDALSGRSLRAVTGHLAELARFERED